jgi:hypothetical protein
MDLDLLARNGLPAVTLYMGAEGREVEADANAR